MIQRKGETVRLRDCRGGTAIELSEYTLGSSFGFLLTMGNDPGMLFDAEQEEHLRQILNERAFAAVDAVRPPRKPGEIRVGDRVQLKTDRAQNSDGGASCFARWFAAEPTDVIQWCLGHQVAFVRDPSRDWSSEPGGTWAAEHFEVVD